MVTLAATSDRTDSFIGLVYIQWFWRNQTKFAKVAAVLDSIWSSFIYYHCEYGKKHTLLNKDNLTTDIYVCLSESAM